MARTGLTPIMEEDQDKSNIQINAESSSTELNASPQQEDPLATEKSLEFEKEKYINKDFSLDKKSSRGKGWFLFLTLIITLGIGFYFYTNKNNEDFFTTLPKGFKKFFLTSTKAKNTLDSALEKTPLIPIQEVQKKIEVASSLDTQLNEMPTKSEKETIEEESSSGTNPNETSARSSEKEVVDGGNSLDIQPKGIPDELSGKIIEQTKTTNSFNQTINDNKKTINLLREEIKSLKSELKENSSTSQKLRAKNPNTTAGVLEESMSRTKALSKNPLSTKTQPLIQENHPQRSEEVQAYLDFIENVGRNFFELIKDGWGRLKILAVELVKKY